MNIRVTPIDFAQDGMPKDGRLYAAMQVYAEKEFGGPLERSFYAKLWVVEAWDTDYSEVVGVTGVRVTADVPTFHVTPPTPNKDGLRIAEQARDAMVGRLHGYFEDMGYRGSPVLIFISAKAQRYWRRYLAKIEAVPANRFSITI